MKANRRPECLGRLRRFCLSNAVNGDYVPLWLFLHEILRLAGNEALARLKVMGGTDETRSPLLMWIAGVIFTRDLSSNVDDDLISGKGSWRISA